MFIILHRTTNDYWSTTGTWTRDPALARVYTSIPAVRMIAFFNRGVAVSVA